MRRRVSRCGIFAASMAALGTFPEAAFGASPQRSAAGRGVGLGSRGGHGRIQKLPRSTARNAVSAERKPGDAAARGYGPRAECNAIRTTGWQVDCIQESE